MTKPQDGVVTEEKPPITLAPLAQRRHEGSGCITRYCATCTERCIPINDACPWCDRPFKVYKTPPSAPKPRVNKASTSYRVWAWLRDNGPADVFDIAEGLGMTDQLARWKVNHLLNRKTGVSVRVVGERQSPVRVSNRYNLRGRARRVYVAIDRQVA